MRIVAASDLHLDPACRTALLHAAEGADLILLAGDFAKRREGLADYMTALEPIADRCVAIPGNNETEAELRAATSMTVLHGETVLRQGLKIAGIGGAIPPLPDVPFASFDIAEDDAAAMLDRIERADILLSHSPPHGIADRFGALGHIGSTAVRAAAERLQPRLLLCGHVHDCWGGRGRIGETLVANLGPVPVEFVL